MGSQRVGHDLVTGQHSCVDHVSPLLLVRRVVWLLAHLSPECVGRYSQGSCLVLWWQSLPCSAGGASLLRGHVGSLPQSEGKPGGVWSGSCPQAWVQPQRRWPLKTHAVTVKLRASRAGACTSAQGQPRATPSRLYASQTECQAVMGIRLRLGLCGCRNQGWGPGLPLWQVSPRTLSLPSPYSVTRFPSLSLTFQSRATVHISAAPAMHSELRLLEEEKAVMIWNSHTCTAVINT